MTVVLIILLAANLLLLYRNGKKLAALEREQDQIEQKLEHQLERLRNRAGP